MKKNFISLFSCFLFLTVTVWLTRNINNFNRHNVLVWDAAGYQLYLPSVLSFHDIDHLQFYSKIDSSYTPLDSSANYLFSKNSSTHDIVIKYTCGVALFQLPLYLIAQLYCHLTNNFPDDGFSAPFQLAVCLSTILFVFAGLLLLRKFLLSYFSDVIVALTIIIIAFGTNLFIYSYLYQGFSHSYLFFLYVVVLFSTYKWYKNPSLKYSMILGFAIGLATLMRPTDSLLILIPLCWEINSFASIKEHFFLWWKNRIKLFAFIIAFLIPLSVQFIYWKHATGSWIYYSYGKEKFDFLHPHIIDGLFSYKKGWFVYTPLALLGFIGFYFSMKGNKLNFFKIPFVFYFLSSIYVLFSWEEWWYGGSFGCRALIQSYALLAIYISYVTHFVLSKQKIIRYSYMVCLALLIVLNCFQSWQASVQIIHWDSMNEKYYWRVFLKSSVTEDDKKLLDLR